VSAAAAVGRRSRLWRESAGIVSVLVLWEVLAILWLSPRHLAPTPVALVATLWHHPNLALWPNLAATLEEAAIGWVAGNAVGIGLAIVFVLVPVAEAALLRVALASYCMPVIAIAPILDVVLSGIAPAAVLAALSVVFTSPIGTLVGLRCADAASLDLVRAYGGGRIAQLRKVRIPAARPATFAALQIAGPAAVLGAVIGEYLGGTKGLGVAMVNSEQGLEVSQTWLLAAIVTAVAGAAYLVTGAVGRLAVPWAQVSQQVVSPANGDRRLGPLARMLRGLAYAVVSAAVIIGLWQALIDVLHLNPFFAKCPAGIWQYLVSSPTAGSSWHQLLSALTITARDAALGYMAGTAAAAAAAVAVAASRTVEHTVMPIAMVLRSVPLVAMAPLLILVFGQGLTSVIVIAGIISFFPTLVNVVWACVRHRPARWTWPWPMAHPR
jgi:sulfonate transport system permease protein